MSSFTHLHIVLNLYDVLSSMEHKGIFSGSECSNNNEYWTHWQTIVFFFLQNIFLCVPQKKGEKKHQWMEWQEGE